MVHYNNNLDELLSGVFKKPTKHNSKTALCLVVVIRNSSSPRKVVDSKEILFNMMKRIVTNAIGNFYKMLHKSGNGAKMNLFPQEDLLSECYIVLDRCLMNFGMVKDRWGNVLLDENGLKTYDISIMRKHDFYHYYNKSLTRSLLTLMNKTCLNLKRLPVISVEEHVSVAKFDGAESADFIKYELHLLGFGRIDIEILYSRLIGEKISTFLGRLKGLNSDEYYKRLKNIKEQYAKIDKMDFEFRL